eukprot:7947708-Heterocapsa_arctica.AAC.1
MANARFIGARPRRASPVALRGARRDISRRSHAASTTSSRGGSQGPGTTLRRSARRLPPSAPHRSTACGSRAWTGGASP